MKVLQEHESHDKQETDNLKFSYIDSSNNSYLKKGMIHGIAFIETFQVKRDRVRIKVSRSLVVVVVGVIRPYAQIHSYSHGIFLSLKNNNE